jgi:hypothetical protein
MSENSFVTYCRKGLSSYGEVQKHNDITEGISDLSIYLRDADKTVWMELKVIDSAPVKPTTKIFWEHYTEQQALWIRRRKGWLFVRVKWASARASYYLFTGAEAWAMWEAGGYPREKFIECAHSAWHNVVNWHELKRVIE